MRELEWDTRVKASDVGVEVKRGVVTLSGTVASWAERIAAENATHRVRGVLDVASELVVKPKGKGPPDADLARAVRHALEWSSFVPSERVTSTVDGGVVTLEGTVDAWTESEDAEWAVGRIKGVVAVLNHIQIGPQATTPADVRGEIVAALERQAEREGKHLSIEVKDGCVTLSGTVRSIRERDAIIGAARGTRGVWAVESHLSVETLA